MNVVKKEYVKILEWGFKLVYLLLALASFNVFLYDSPVQPLLVKVCLVMGGLLLFGRLCFFRDYLKTPGWLLLLLFCSSFLASMFANRQYGAFTADLKWLIWTGMLFFLLYVCDGERTTEEYKKEFNVFSHIIISYSFLASAISLYFLINGYQAKWYTTSGELMLAGFQWGRLWGVYTDPNYGGVFSVAAVLLCIYSFRTTKGWKKIPYTVTALLDCLYIVFSDSRTAVTALIAAGMFWTIFAAALRKNKKGLAVRIVAVILFAGLFAGSASHIKEQYREFMHADVGRREDLQNNVTNGRLDLWKSGVDVWKTKPVFGTGYNSFLPHTKENLPDTYAVKNAQGVFYVSLHNEFVNILVYHGIMGFGIFLAFGVRVLWFWLVNVGNTEEKDRDYMGVLVSCIFVVMVSMVFLLEGLHTNSPGTFILWSFAGYAIHYCTKKRKADIQE